MDYMDFNINKSYSSDYVCYFPSSVNMPLLKIGLSNAGNTSFVTRRTEKALFAAEVLLEEEEIRLVISGELLYK